MLGGWMDDGYSASARIERVKLMLRRVDFSYFL